MKIQTNFTELSVYRVKDFCEPVIETDALAVEEPLEIRLGFIENGKAAHKSISITMRGA